MDWIAQSAHRMDIHKKLHKKKKKRAVSQSIFRIKPDHKRREKTKKKKRARRIKKRSKQLKFLMSQKLQKQLREKYDRQKKTKELNRVQSQLTIKLYSPPMERIAEHNLLMNPEKVKKLKKTPSQLKEAQAGLKTAIFSVLSKRRNINDRQKDQYQMKVLTNVSLDLMPILNGMRKYVRGFNNMSMLYLEKKWEVQSRQMFRKLRFKNRKVKKIIKFKIGEKWKLYLQQIYGKYESGLIKAAHLLVLSKFPKQSMQSLAQIIIIKHSLIMDVVQKSCLQQQEIQHMADLQVFVQGKDVKAFFG